MWLFLFLKVSIYTCGQAQLREVTLQEENVAYERAISNCETKIKEKIQEADLLRRKLMVRSIFTFNLIHVL